MKRSETNEMSPGKTRRTMNVFSLLVTCAVLLFSLEMSRGEISSGIYKMTTDINRALMQVLAGIGEFNYTEHTPRTDYNSSTAFNNKGMALLYNATTIFMKALLPNPTPNGLVIVENDQTIKIKDNDYGALVKHYIGYIIFITILALFALLMPICGFCFCCCRCCGNCGGRSKPFNKKGDFCKKFIYGTLLIALGTLFLFGVVCAFVSNQTMQDGTDSLASNLRTSSNDASAFLDDTNKHVEILLQKNFKEFQTVIMDALNKSSDILYDQLKEISKAASMDDAQKIVEYMEPVREELMQIKILINRLRVEASQLNDATRKIKRDLLDTIKDCRGRAECEKLMQDYISKLGTDIDFNSIPDVSDQINELDKIVNLGLTEKVKEGIAELEGIKTSINNKVKGNIINVGNEIDRAGETIRKESNSVLKLLNDANKSLKDMSKKYLDETDKYVREYSQYRYYVGLTVSCVLLLITLCIALGLICGVCGKRPGSYNDDCCNKGAGSKFLIFGVAIMFLFACIFVIVLLIHSVGIFVHFLVCEPVRNPENNTALDFVESLIDTKKLLGSDMKISSVLTNCYKNKSAYTVFNLKERFDLSKVKNYTKEFNIEHFLKEIENEIDKVNVENIELLKGDTLEKFEELKKIKLSDINFKKIIEELSINFTTVDLREISDQLQKYIDSLPKAQIDLITSLKNIKIHIDAYIEKLFIPMTENANNVKTLAIKIEKDLRFGKDSFEEAITDLVKNIKEAQENLKVHGQAELKNITKKFSYAILDHTQSYLDRVVAKFQDDVGECGPLALVINGTMTSTCDKILLPMNGFWFSILWCLILFIPSIIISVKLASLYQKYDPYPGSFVESEYLYDAYADRENIPLARGKHGKKKHKKKRPDGRYVTETYEPGHREPGGSYHPDARYADMAPKHFEDYPNGGPPQYQRATEYERPPPYYYPGTGDQN